MQFLTVIKITTATVYQKTWVMLLALTEVLYTHRCMASRSVALVVSKEAFA